MSDELDPRVKALLKRLVDVQSLGAFCTVHSAIQSESCRTCAAQELLGKAATRIGNSTCRDEAQSKMYLCEADQWLDRCVDLINKDGPP